MGAPKRDFSFRCYISPEAAGRQVSQPTTHPAAKIEYARLLKGPGSSLGQIAAKTDIPKTSLHRYLTPEDPG